MINKLIHIMSLIIPISKSRKNFRLKMQTLIHGAEIFKKAAHVGKDFACAKNVSCNKNTYIGNNVRINDNFKVNGNGKITIKDNCQFGPDCMIFTQNHNYYNGDKIPYDEKYIYKDVEINENVWCGGKVIILPGTKIGEGAVIQAGAVVHGEIPPCAVVGGNPAKVFKYRDLEHYQKLKSENKILYNYI